MFIHGCVVCVPLNELLLVVLNFSLISIEKVDDVRRWRMYLPKTEIFIYFVVYILFLCYGIYQIYMLSDGEFCFIFFTDVGTVGVSRGFLELIRIKNHNRFPLQ